MKRGPGRPARLSPDLMAGGREADEREREEREALEREYSDAERLEVFRDSLHQSILPNLPDIPGYHVCWLTTSNPRDSIAWRMRIGYSLIRVEELPGWGGEVTASAVAGYDGIVGINEMVAAKIPTRLYNQMMTIAHHEQPLVEEDKLRNQMLALSDELERHGSKLEVGDGTGGLGHKAPRRPAFQE